MDWKKIESWCRIVVFAVAFLSLSAASMLWPDQGFSETENRFLQQRPTFTLKRLADGSFGTDYDAYLSDQFPLRALWVRLKTTADRFTNRQDSNGVYFGKDGYLLERFETGDIDEVLLGKNQERLADFVEKYEALLGEGRVKVMLVPSASQILKEKLPDFAVPYDQSAIYDPMIEQLGEAVVLPLESLLKEVKEDYIFYRTDHHWTVDGAYEAYRYWMRAMNRCAWTREQFVKEQLTAGFYGTVQAKVGIQWEPDEMYRYVPKAAPTYEVRYDLEEESTGSLYQMTALNTRDKYAVYLNGNHALTRVESDAAEGEGRRLLIVKDSFAHSFAPFAVNHFEKTVMVDFRYYNGSLLSLAQEEGITDVLLLYQAVNFAGDVQLSKLLR